MKWGCLWFDNPEHPDTGWACIAGETPFPVRGGVPTSHREGFFWSNLPAPLLSKDILLDCFLSTSLTELAAELGTVDRSSLVHMASHVIDRVMRLALHCYNIDISKILRESKISKISLITALRSYQLFADETLASTEAGQSLASALRVWTDCSSQQHSQQAVLLRRSRWLRAHELMRSPMPGMAGSGWSRLTDLPATDRAAWVAELPRPALSWVRARSLPDRLAPLLPWAAEEGCWVAQPDLLLLSMLGAVEVDRVLVASHYAWLRSHPRLFVPADDVELLSLSLGLLTECYLEAVAGVGDTATESRVPTASAVWLAALDRFPCFLAAAQLSAAGYCVAGYGRGRIKVYADPQRVPDLLSLSRPLHLTGPLAVPGVAAPPDPSLERTIPELPEPPALHPRLERLLRWEGFLYQAGAEALLRVDQLIDLPAQRRADALKAILADYFEF